MTYVTCPTCHTRFPLEAGFADDDGKRLAALCADMEPVLGRAVLAYLRLFKPPRQQLRSARAVRIVSELVALIDNGSVCRDERGSARRPATPALWAQGMEQLLREPGRLTLPLANHHYLRAVVYGLADKADAAAERQHEADRRAGRHRAQAAVDAPADTGLREALRRIEADFQLKLIDRDEARRRADAARADHEAKQ